jgi:hypothetical protein
MVTKWPQSRSHKSAIADITKSIVCFFLLLVCPWSHPSFFLEKKMNDAQTHILGPVYAHFGHAIDNKRHIGVIICLIVSIKHPKRL